ncbi:MAG: 2-octaprenyl-6-methoxyphenyl hydroxylase [Proteobacteria bacterium]|nr:2-octaprenyl-6-methoxyphenyl hydroxylase [Pseudomonadota bacterium]
MVGAALAVALQNTGLRVTVVEAVSPRAQMQPSFDDRSTALAYTSRRILETLGVWPLVSPAAYPIKHVHVSQQRRLGVTRLSAAEEDLPALGYVVPNRVLGHALMATVAQSKHVEFISPTRVTGIHRDDDRVDVVLETEGAAASQIAARLLVVADGAQSPLREMLGVGARNWDYGQSAIICNVEAGRPHDNVAYERFTPEGPMALLPLDERRMALVLVERTGIAADVMKMDDAAFLDRVQRRFGERLGKIERAGERAAYPLSLVTAQRQVADRAVILGNAAHSLHPIAGQGFNLSLRDVAVLAEVLAAHRADPGIADALAAYIKWRRQDQRRVVAFTDLLNRLFGIPFGLAAHARGLGLLGMDLFPGLRREFSRHAMGRAGKLPRLARGLPL